MKKIALLLLCLLLLVGCGKKEEEIYIPAQPAGWEDSEFDDEEWDDLDDFEDVDDLDLDDFDDWDDWSGWNLGGEEEEVPFGEPKIAELDFEPEQDEFIRVRDVIRNIPVELRYAEEDNVFGTAIYNSKDVFLRYGTIQKLAAVQEALWKDGYSLKIWDGFRPHWAQVQMWNLIPDAEFVSNPYTGTCSHVRGGAVDVTLVDSKGNPVKMPTDFDVFTAQADRDYSDVSSEAAKNAKYLEEMMTKFGFVPYEAEWWHFTDEDEYELEQEFSPGVSMTWVPNCKEYISLREKPDVHGGALAKIECDEPVTILGWEGNFAKVDYQGQVGYVLASYIMPMDEDVFTEQMGDLDFTEKYSYADMIYDMEVLQEDYPDLVELDTIGQSEEGVDIPVLMIGNPEASREVLIQASIHGREHATGWLSMVLAAKALKEQADFLQDVRFHIIPMANPDGVKISQSRSLGDNQKIIYNQDKTLKLTKEKQTTYAAHWKANSQGIDLNRNFSAGWDKLENRSYPSAQWFNGSQPFSAAETRALRDYTQAHKFAATVSLHAPGNIIYYAYGDRQPANQNSHDLANALQSVNGYYPVGSSGNDGGGFKDWAIDELGIPSITVEIGSDIKGEKNADLVPLPERDLYTTFQRNVRMLEAIANWVLAQ